MESPVRVIRTLETTQHRRRVAGQWVHETKEQEWYWVTTVSPQDAAAPAVARWGHARWDIENREFNELVQHWHMDHCFKHDPTAIEALLLTLALTFAVTNVFFARNLNPQARTGCTRLFLASLLAADLLSGPRLRSRHNRSP